MTTGGVLTGEMNSAGIPMVEGVSTAGDLLLLLVLARPPCPLSEFLDTWGSGVSLVEDDSDSLY